MKESINIANPAAFFANRLAVRFAALTQSVELAICTVDLRRGPGEQVDILYHIRPDVPDATTRSNAVTAFKEIVLRYSIAGRGGYMRVTEDQWCLVTLFAVEENVCGAAAFVTRSADEAVIARRMSLLNGNLQI